MVFSDQRSRLIDFDFAGEAGKRMYPATLEVRLTDAQRHSDITAEALEQGLCLKYEHDWFAAASVMKCFSTNSERDTCPFRAVAKLVEEASCWWPLRCCAATVTCSFASTSRPKMTL